MASLLSAVLFALLSCAVLVVYLTARPWNFPRNVPAIPLWMQMRARLTRVPSTVFYNDKVRPLAEKHGAVALWQEDRWVVVVYRPEFIAQVLKNSNQELEKRGTFARNPHSNGGFLFGMNIIDANGQLHAEFTDIIKPALVKRISITSMKTESLTLANRLCEAQEAAGDMGISLDAILWRWAITVFSDYFLDIKEWPLSYRETSAQQITATQSPTWFSRLRSSFLFLNRISWPTAGYKKATALIQQLEDTLVDIAESRKAASPATDDDLKLVHRLIRARDEGLLSDFHLRSNLKQLLVAGHENVEVVLQSAMYELALHPSIQKLLHEEVTGLLPADYSLTDVDRLPLLASVVYEALRLYPALGTLTNRRTVKPMQLGADIVLPADTQVGWSAYAVQRNTDVWGPTAGIFDPFRWGSDIDSIKRMARSRQARGQFVPFSLHARRCLGSSFALTQLKVGLCELVRSIEWSRAKESRLAYSKFFLVSLHNCKFNISKRQ